MVYYFLHKKGVNNMEKIIEKIVNNHSIIKIIVSNPRKKSEEVKKITLRPVIIHGEEMFQMESHFSNKVTHANCSRESLTGTLYESMKKYKQMNIFSKEEDIQILAGKIEKPHVKTSKAALSCDSVCKSHNRQKNYIIEEGKPCDFLIALGVMTKDGQVVKKYYNKFRQINRFLEIISDSLPAIDKDYLKIIDFGCGKSYLTFAVYYYLVKMLGKKVNITGLDLKENVIRDCNRIAEELNYEGLEFRLGDIADYKDTGCDMIITLHACDTATDYALINAVSWNTRLILSVPCCQHELFSQIDNATDNAFLKHGILKDKFTEILTNGIRGLMLEACGYDVSMIEFTSLEHTAKNVMIKAVKSEKPSKKHKEKALSQYEELKEKYRINPTIEKLKDYI